MESREIMLLLCFNEQKKKIQIKDNSYSSFLEHLKNNETLRDFVGPDIIYQVYDEDFDDYVDLDEHTILKNKIKVKAMLKKKRSNEEEQCSPQKRLNYCESQDVAEPSSSNQDLLNADENINIAEPGLITWVAENLKEGIVNCSRTAFALTYTLPDLPEIFLSAEKYKGLSPPAKISMNKELIRILFSDLIKRYGLYPHHKIVAEKLIMKYPHLKSEPGEGHEMWYQSLRSKFKNFRQNLNNIKIVADNKKKYGKDSYKNVQPAATGSEINTIVNVERVQLADMECFEDEDSIAIHKSVMINEMEKAEIDWEIIDSKMDKTMSDRRQILKEEAVDKVLRDYPALSDARQIILEFERITKISFEKKLKETIPKVSEKIWVLAKKDTAALKAEILEVVKKGEDPEAMKSNMFSDFLRYSSHSFS